MRRANLEYQRALDKQFRDRAYGLLSIGVVNKQAQADGVITSSNYLSNNKSPFKLGKVSMTYASFEENQTRADGKYYFPPANDMLFQLPFNVGAIGEDILGSIRVNFNTPFDIKGITIDFGDSYPTEFTITNGSDTYTYTLDNPNFECTDNFNSTEYIEITPTSFVDGNNKRLRINYILMGIGLVFDNQDISEIKMSESTSFVSGELPSIKVTAKIIDRFHLFDVDDTSSFINYLADGQDLSFSLGQTLEDGSIYYIDMPNTYLSDWKSNGFYMSFTATDRLKLYDDTYTGGNYIHTRTLYDDAIAVLTDMGLEPDEYSVDNCLKDVEVTNPLPAKRHRECLQLIANAGRCALMQGQNGKILMPANFENIVEPEDLIVTTTGESAWSNGENARFGSNIVYADFTRNFASADGSMLFIPEDSEEYLDDTTFVSERLADKDGQFFANVIEPPYDTQIMGNPRSWNGLTCTADEDGSVHIQGTCTANTWYSFFSNNTARRYMSVEDCPWTKGDVLECDYFLEGTSQGTMGIACGYKTTDSSANQGHTNYRNLPCNFTNSKYVMSDKRVQTIDPRVDKAGMCWTSYIYIQSGCVCDVVVKPMLTVRKTLGNILAHNYYRLGQRGVNNIWTHNGVTYTVLEDGGILVNGTATAESTFELINPYVSSELLVMEVGHTYILSEGTGRTEHHTNPLLQWVRYNSSTKKYDYGLNTADGDKTYTHTDSNLSQYGVRVIVSKGKTANNVVLYPSLIDVDSYDVNEPNPKEHSIGARPSLTMKLPAAYTYHTMAVTFNGNPPPMFNVKTYYENGLLDDVDVEVTGRKTTIYHSFYQFDKIVFTFTKGAPYNRILVNKIAFGDITNYRLTRDDMLEDPVGFMEKKVKDVQVKIYTFNPPEEEGQNPQQVDDNVFYTHNINTTGKPVKLENPLIGTEAHAQQVAEWLGNYYANNVTYQVKYRGDPRLDASDIIFMDSKLLNNLQVEIESLELKFNGAYSGTLNLRRATNMLVEE